MMEVGLTTKCFAPMDKTPRVPVRGTPPCPQARPVDNPATAIVDPEPAELALNVTSTNVFVEACPVQGVALRWSQAAANCRHPTDDALNSHPFIWCQGVVEMRRIENCWYF